MHDKSYRVRIYMLAALLLMGATAVEAGNLRVINENKCSLSQCS